MSFVHNTARNIFFILVIAFLFHSKAKAQICSPDYFFKRYQGNNAVYPFKIISTPQNDIIAGGATLKVNGEFPDATDGWVTKLSSKGTVLWSKRYFIGGFNSGGFQSIENATDSNYIVTARFGKYKKTFSGGLEELDAASFIILLDKFGNVSWIKRITNYIDDSHLSKITRLQNNSFLISGNIINSQGAKLLLLKIDVDGTVAWHKIIYSEEAQLGTATVKELSNGQLALAGATLASVPNSSQYYKQGYYYLKVDPADGAVIHQSAFYFNPDPSDHVNSFENVKKIIELPNDTLLFATSFSERSNYGIDPGVKEALLFKTGVNGQFYNADGYYNTQPGFQLIDINYINNQYEILADDGFKSIYAELNRDGDIINQKAYGTVYSLLKAYKLLDGNPSGRYLFGGRKQYPLLGLMKTEEKGFIPCMETAVQLIKIPVSSLFSTGAINLSYINTSYPFAFEDIGQSLGWSNYVFNTTIDCFASCCDNIESDTTHTELCNALQYRLPDNSIVKESGIYYTQHTTANNCDSTAYYDILFSTKPKVNLGEDTCFGNSATVTLHTDSGYVSYSWMGTNSTSHKYVITSPGIYSVSVTNQCGTSQDEIEVFRECNFPVYMPTAFTPGNDGLNDLYRYPSLNINKFVSLEIFNRYGQKVFLTNNKSEGWDGKFKNSEQPSGIYAYILRLKTLDGKEVFKKGIFMLMRR